mmetsp:Transcript_8203/g.10375  ORF Transcript_8203/g.10375 Transcript_8203/m.10375 type:complete len:84 (+) Transcript_8203:101-352(+)
MNKTGHSCHGLKQDWPSTPGRSLGHKQMKHTGARTLYSFLLIYSIFRSSFLLKIPSRMLVLRDFLNRKLYQPMHSQHTVFVSY